MLHAMLKKVAILVLSVLGTAVSAGDLVTRTAQVHSIDHGYEAMLINALEKIGDNRIHEALDELEMLTRLQPDFKLAQLV